MFLDWKTGQLASPLADQVNDRGSRLVEGKGVDELNLKINRQLKSWVWNSKEQSVVEK